MLGCTGCDESLGSRVVHECVVRRRSSIDGIRFQDLRIDRSRTEGFVCLTLQHLVIYCVCADGEPRWDVLTVGLIVERIEDRAGLYIVTCSSGSHAGGDECLRRAGVFEVLDSRRSRIEGRRRTVVEVLIACLGSSQYRHILIVDEACVLAQRIHRSTGCVDSLFARIGVNHRIRDSVNLIQCCLCVSKSARSNYIKCEDSANIEVVAILFVFIPFHYIRTEVWIPRVFSRIVCPLRGGPITPLNEAISACSQEFIPQS